jgi:predicted membrane-bound spermidine synthase
MLVRAFTLLFFLSGSAGLIYEVVWTRAFADVVGSTALSMTAVFSVFLLALACGAQLFGRLDWSGRRALAAYGWLEIGIAVSALASSAALILGRTWIAVRIPESDSFAVTLGLQLAVTAVLIGIPVTLMGGTLPLILSAARSWAIPRNVVASLYGWNTLGAGCGALAAGFVLIWRFGLRGTLAFAVGLNLLAGLAALLIASRLRETRGPTIPGAAVLENEDDAGVGSGSSAVDGRLAVAFFSGFGVLACEILWGRIAKFLLGDRTIAVSLLLFVFICALGLGSLIAPSLGRRFAAGPGRTVGRLIAWILLLGGLAHMAMVPLASATVAGGGLTGLIAFDNEFLRRVVTVAILILPPILLLGLVFPLLAWSAREIDRTPGRVIGNLYFVNTVGAVLGAAMASFVLSRSLGTLTGFLVLAGLLVTVAACWLILRAEAIRGRVVAGLALVAFIAAAVYFPKDLVQLREDEQLVEAREDEYGVQVLARTGDGTLRVRNNRLSLIYDLGEWSTSHAQQMAAHMSVLLAGECRDVLNLGTGYGITAGTYTLYDDVESIETVEILPFLVERQELFKGYNFDYLQDARVTLVQGDGRHYLVSSPHQYDIISVNVLDPYLPGSSSLFTVDFWETVHDRLRPGGVFTGLFWGADVDLLSRGLKTVFPDMLYFPAYDGTAFNIVVFRDALPDAGPSLHLDRLSLVAQFAVGGLMGGDPATALRDELDRALAYDPGPVDAATASSRLHTDDFPVLEYRWFHGVEWVSILDSPMVDPD